MKNIIEKVLEFRAKRNWDTENDPRSLAISMIIECGELLENFQWNKVPDDLENTKEEIADVIIYAIALAEKLNINLEKAIEEKLVKNAIKYPEAKK